MVKRTTLVSFLLLTLLMSGCAWFGTPPEADLLRENRQHLVESIRPALVDALDKARRPDGMPLYIDPYRDEKVNLLDRIIIESARVAPSDEDGGLYSPEPLPWKE